MKRTILIISIALISFYSCNEKSNPDPEPEKTVLDYFPLNVGNYWVYESSSCDSSWVNCNSGSIDTNWITKDTIINNYTYYKLEGKNILNRDTPVFLRDSASYIITNSGSIFLSDKDFNNKYYERYEVSPVSNDTIFHLYYQMVDKPNMVIVPLGTYDCIDFRGSLFRKQDSFALEFNTHQYFAKNVGPIYQNAIFASSLGGLKRELVSYNIVTE